MKWEGTKTAQREGNHVKQSRRSAILTALLVLVASGIVRARSVCAHIGPHIGYNFDIEELALGAQFSIPILHHVEFYPSFDYYFVDPGSQGAINADLKWRVATDRPRW